MEKNRPIKSTWYDWLKTAVSRNKPSKLKILKQSGDTIIKNIRNPFKLEKENKTMKTINTLFE